MRTMGVDGDRLGARLKRLVIACWLGAGLLGLLCLASAYKWELDQQFVCDGDNCVVDSRGWIEAHPVPLVAFVLFTSSSLVLMAVYLVQRRRA